MLSSSISDTPTGPTSCRPLNITSFVSPTGHDVVSMFSTTNHPTGIIVHSVVVNVALQTREHGTPLAELQGSLLGHRRPLLVIVELSLALVLDVIQSKASCVIIDPSSSRCHVLHHHLVIIELSFLQPDAIQASFVIIDCGGTITRWCSSSTFSYASIHRVCHAMLRWHHCLADRIPV